MAVLIVGGKFSRSLGKMTGRDYMEKLTTSNLKTIIRSDYNVIHASSTLNAFPLYFIALIKRAKLYITVRGWADLTNAHGEFSSIKYFIIKAISNFTFSRAFRISISYATTKRVRECYPFEFKTIQGRPVDINYFKKGRTSSKYDVPVILTVTNLRYREKAWGVLELIEVLKDVRREGKEFFFLIAGNGRYYKTVEEKCKEFEFAIPLGYVSDIPDLLDTADIFVYFSYLDSYASVISEAQTSLPVICNDYGGVPEACGYGGIIVRNKEELKLALLNLLENKKELRKLKKFCSKRINLHNKKVIESYESIWGVETSLS